MDWKYKRERKMNQREVAQVIHDTVTMEEVLRAYCPDIRIRHNRCPCPLHNGKDDNFSISTHAYKCFVCGAAGDSIGFVKLYLGLPSRIDAMKRMNADLCLRIPIDDAMSVEEDRKIRARVEQAREEREKEETWWAEYHRLLDEWVQFDKTRRTAEWNSPEYADAVKNIDRVAYELDCHMGRGGKRLNT